MCKAIIQEQDLVFYFNNQSDDLFTCDNTCVRMQSQLRIFREV